MELILFRIQFQIKCIEIVLHSQMIHQKRVLIVVHDLVSYLQSDAICVDETFVRIAVIRNSLKRVAFCLVSELDSMTFIVVCNDCYIQSEIESGGMQKMDVDSYASHQSLLKKLALCSVSKCSFYDTMEILSSSDLLTLMSKAKDGNDSLIEEKRKTDIVYFFSVRKRRGFHHSLKHLGSPPLFQFLMILFE